MKLSKKKKQKIWTEEDEIERLREVNRRLEKENKKLDKFFRRWEIAEPIIDGIIYTILAAAFALVFGGGFTAIMYETGLPEFVCWMPVIGLFIYLLVGEYIMRKVL